MAVNDSLLGLLMSVFASELERFSAQFILLLKESIPGLSTENLLLTDWERIAGLPDECTELGDTEIQRQRAVHNKIYANYTGLSEQFFIDYAAGLNVTITIENEPGGDVFRTTTKTGGALQRVSRMPPNDIDGSRLASIGSLYTVRITVVADPDGNQDVLECIFNKWKSFFDFTMVKLP